MELWDRQDSETPRAYAAFIHYCEQPPVSRNVRATRGAGFANASHWCKANSWVPRVKAYDAHLAEERLAKRKAQLEEAMDLHVKYARELIEEAMDDDTLPMRDRSRVLSEMALLERISLGWSARVEVDGKITSGVSTMARQLIQEASK